MRTELKRIIVAISSITLLIIVFALNGRTLFKQNKTPSSLELLHKELEAERRSRR